MRENGKASISRQDKNTRGANNENPHRKGTSHWGGAYKLMGKRKIGGAPGRVKQRHWLRRPERPN